MPVQAHGQEGVALPDPRVSIAVRPLEADDGNGLGHWEADGVIGVDTNLHTKVGRKIG